MGRQLERSCDANNMNIRLILFAVAILGMLVSGYLLVAYVSEGSIVCGVSGGCDLVRASRYASFIGVPTPAFGLLYYLLLAIGVILAREKNQRVMRIMLLILTGVGLAVSAYLSWLEAFVILAWCMWCVVSAVLSVVAWGLVWGSKWPKVKSSDGRIDSPGA